MDRDRRSKKKGYRDPEDQGQHLGVFCEIVASTVMSLNRMPQSRTSCRTPATNSVRPAGLAEMSRTEPSRFCTTAAAGSETAQMSEIMRSANPASALVTRR